MTNKLTKEQAAIIGAYTGIACGPFTDIHGLVEKLLNRPVYTHEFGSMFGGEKMMAEVKEKVKPLFLEICYGGEMTNNKMPVVGDIYRHKKTKNLYRLAFQLGYSDYVVVNIEDYKNNFTYSDSAESIRLFWNIFESIPQDPISQPSIPVKDLYAEVIEFIKKKTGAKTIGELAKKVRTPRLKSINPYHVNNPIEELNTWELRFWAKELDFDMNKFEEIAKNN